MKAGTAPIFVSLFLSGVGLCSGLRHSADAEKHLPKPPQDKASKRRPAEAVEPKANNSHHSEHEKPEDTPPQPGMIRYMFPNGPRWINRWDRVGLTGNNASEPFEMAYHFDDWVSGEQLTYVNLSRPACVRPVGSGKNSCMLLSHGICVKDSKGISSLKGGYGKCMERRKTCAVVGSSQHLLNATWGTYIDGHDVVIRINSAPAGTMFPPTPLPNVKPEFPPKFLEGLAKHVGTRTDVRFVNSYGMVPEFEGADGDQCIFLHNPKIPEACGTLCSRNAGFCNMTCESGVAGCTHKASRCDLKDFKCMGSEMEAEKDWGTRNVFLENYFGMIADAVVPHTTAGFKALLYAMSRCEQVTVLGFGPSCNGQAGARYYRGAVDVAVWHHYNEELMLLKRAAKRGSKVLLHPDVRQLISAAKTINVQVPHCVDKPFSAYMSKLLESVRPDGGVVSLIREPPADGAETSL